MKKGKHYYNNRVEEKVFYDGEEPAGFVRGGLPKKTKAESSHNSSKICVNNGIKNIYIYMNLN